MININWCVYYAFSYLYHFCIRFSYALRWNYWPGLAVALAVLVVELTGLDLGLEELGLGLGTCGLVNINAWGPNDLYCSPRKMKSYKTATAVCCIIKAGCLGSVAKWLGCRTCDQQVVGSNPGLPTVKWYPGQVVNAHVPLSPLTNQYNLVPATGRRCLAAGKVAVGLASPSQTSGSPPTGSRLQRGRRTWHHSRVW